MSWIYKTFGIAVLGGLMATQPLAAEPRAGARVGIRGGFGPRIHAVQRIPLRPRIFVGANAYFGSRWYGDYGPGWYYPYGTVYSAPLNLGDVKIDTHLKDGSVYVDGGYVGPISKFKKFSLSPGNHDIEIRDASGVGIFKQRVQVIVNKSIELKPPA